MRRVVLFDFHNTLATCPGWLQLEIATLPALALARLEERGLVRASSSELERASALFKALRQLVRESGAELSAVEGTARVLTQLGHNVPLIEIESVVEELERACLPEVEMVPGADRALTALRDAGFVLGVVSSAGYPPFVEFALEKLGLRGYFSEVVTSAAEGLYKSDPEIFRLAARRLGFEPHEAIHVGDHAVYDVRAAKAAGLKSVWFVRQARQTAALHGVAWSEAELDGGEADAVIAAMEELPAVVERLSA